MCVLLAFADRAAGRQRIVRLIGTLVRLACKSMHGFVKSGPMAFPGVGACLAQGYRGSPSVCAAERPCQLALTRHGVGSAISDR